MNEAKAKAEELQRQLNETNSQRARAQAESGKHLSFYCVINPLHFGRIGW